MKRIFAFLLCFITILGTVGFAAEPSSITTAKEYELWTQSPAITCGITEEELMIYKAMKLKMLSMYKLDEIGDKYYLAVCESQMRNGGYNSNKKTSYYYTYVLYETDESFIILSRAPFFNNEYYWSYDLDFADLTGVIDEQYYKDLGLEVPKYIYSMNGKYTNSNYEEYMEYAIITDKGNTYKFSFNDDYGCASYPLVYNKKLYTGTERYRSGGSTYFYKIDGEYATVLKEIQLNNNVISYGESLRIIKTTLESDEAYKSYHEDENIIELKKMDYYSIPGSDSLFYKYKWEKTYNPDDRKYYYYLRINVLKSVNGDMQPYSTGLLPTTYTYDGNNVNLYDINGINAEVYKSMGKAYPKILIGNYGVILNDGTVCALNLNTQTYYGSYYDFCVYNGRFGVNRCRTAAGYDYRPDPDTDSASNYYWQNVNYIDFDTQGNMTLSEDISFRISNTKPDNLKGYYTGTTSSYFKESVKSSKTIATVQEWWGRERKNVFPDGRYVKVDWMGISSYVYELWYYIYNPDGTLRSTGPTGYTRDVGTTAIEDSAYGETLCIAINNSKFVATITNLEKSWHREYYRVAVVTENNTGEIGANVQLGEKNITPPDTADTEVVLPTIDFGQNELPIGFNIKENVIDTGNFETELREQVNSVRLNDIVILINDKYQSGRLNTGMSLSSFSRYDYSMGSSYIRVYTNGQNLCWYCSDPSRLSEGSYEQTYYINDKTIYVKFIVVKPPANEGSTTVVF